MVLNTQYVLPGQRKETADLLVCRGYSSYSSPSLVLTGLYCWFLITDGLHHIPQHLPYKAEILFLHISTILWNIASQDA